MTETFLRVSDVADEIVQSYLHRLTHRIGSDKVKEAWFRVVAPGSMPLPTEDGESVAINPIFEVMVSVSEPMPELSRALAQAATDMSGRVRVMADGVMDGQLTSADLERGGWRSTEIPRMTQEALAV